MEVLAVVAIVALSLAVVLVKHLDKTLDIRLTAKSLRNLGVPEDEIRKIALAAARRERRHIVLQVLDRIVKFRKA